MEKILGIDLGTNSIGWAIREINPSLKNQIIDKGVLTFEKGVGQGKSGEFPMVQKRTESRHKRRNYQAEKYRKWELLKCLIENKMCPLTIDELNEWRYYKKDTKRKYPQSQKFIEWLRFDFNGDGKPDFELFGFDKHESYYIFRVMAISEKSEHKNIFAKNPQIIGRIFYQLVQRRGFKGRDEEEAQTMLKGSEKNGVRGRNDIENYLEKYNSLGSALYHLQKKEKVRIRKRYNLRTDYENELKLICKVQSIDNSIYMKLWKAIVWQRPLRSQKGLVGICTFEKNKSRCPISHPLYEEFRTWVFINNLKLLPPESIDKKEYLKSKIYPEFYKSGNDFKLSVIYSTIKKDGAQVESDFKEDTKVLSVKLLNSFKNLLGENWKEKFGWSDIISNNKKNCPYNIEDIWHVLVTFDSVEKLKEFAEKKLCLTPENSEKFSKIKLPQGYATLSLSAIKKILPFLYRGFIYSEAIYLANLSKVFGEKELDQNIINNFESLYNEIRTEHEELKILNKCVNEIIREELNAPYQERYRIEDNRELDNQEKDLVLEKLQEAYGPKTWKNLSETQISTAKSYIEFHFREFLKKPLTGKKEDLFLPTPNLHSRIKEYLRLNYNIEEGNLNKLWHPSEQEVYENAQSKKLQDGTVIKILGDPQPISRGFKNPMALKTLHKLKKLINYLLEMGKIDESTRIVVEIARELNDANRRKAIEKWQRDREKENEEFAKIIIGTAKIKYPDLDENNPEIINKFRLWFEQIENGSEIYKQTTALKDDIAKYRLWNEQKGICLYTGNFITISDLFNGIKYDIEHTIPASMSFDNELKNLTIADSKYNREIKSKKIPFDCPNYYEDVTINGVTYKSIIKNIETIFGERRISVKKVKGKEIEFVSYKKIYDLEKLHDEWKNKSSDSKEIKDSIIQRRHLIKMELDYWRKKLDTFTCKEYKSGWRNSQLRDTQIITKYALPYLKTVFEKVDVQKGSITNDFRKIYKIEPKSEKKQRDKHTHHAIDAAVLTLIPPPVFRDKILNKYNEANDLKISYHEPVMQWLNFDSQAIKKIIESETLINFQAQSRALTQTVKNVRKRGKLQYVKYKDKNGKWHFKLDINNKKIPLIAKGDTIRGQLHKESFFGAIEKDGEIILVERYPISAFTSINDCKNIIDVTVAKLVKDTISKRMSEGMSFDQAKQNPIAFPSGKAIIKKVRCRVAAGRGFLTPSKALEIHSHNVTREKHFYKNFVYAQNNENTLCLYYEGIELGKISRAFRIVGLFELAQLNLNKLSAIKNDHVYRSINVGNEKKETTLLLNEILKIGTRVIFYNENIEELKEISNMDLLKRLFNIYKFNVNNTPYLYLQNHLEARSNDLLDDGDTAFNSHKYQYRLKIKADKFVCAIEGKHFFISPDGNIHWIF